MVQHSGKPRVLIVGPRGGSTGGVAMFNDILLASRLRDAFDLIHLDTTRTVAGFGKATTLAPINLLYFARQFLKLAWLLATRRPRIMHQPITAGLSYWKEGAFMALARLFGVRIVAHLHAGTFAAFHDAAGPGTRSAIARSLLRARVVIALSEGWREFLRAAVSARLNVAVVPNTVDPAFARWADGLERPAERAGVTVLYVGRLGLRKGVVDALTAAPRVRERHPETRFVFAGEAVTAVDREAIERARAAAGASGIEFPGVVAGDRKHRLFAEADIFLLPSYVENQPIAVLEAMAAGLPLVVTPVGSLPEFLEEGRNALFVPPGDADAIASRIGELASRPDLRRAMGAANRARFLEGFAPDAMIDKIERIYQTLIA